MWKIPRQILNQKNISPDKKSFISLYEIKKTFFDSTQLFLDIITKCFFSFQFLLIIISRSKDNSIY